MNYNLQDEITKSVADEVKKVMGLSEAPTKEKGDEKAIADHPVDKKKDPEQEKQVEDKDVEEGNEFTKAAAKAKLAGKDEFEFDGKTYPTEISQDAAEKILGKSEEKKTEEVEESVDGRTKEFKEKLKKLSYAKDIAEEEEDDLDIDDFDLSKVDISDKDLEDKELDEAITQIVKEEKLDVDSLSEEQLDELIGKALKKIGGAIKSRITTSGRADRATKKADKADKKKADRERLAKAKRRLAIQKAQKKKAIQKKRAAKARMRREDVELDESTAEYAKSLEKIANDRKMKSISKKDRDTLAKIADLLKRANEATGKDEDLKEYVGPALTPANQIAKKFGGKVKAINVKDEKGKKTKMFYAEDEDEIEEAIDPRKFALGGNTKATKRDVDAILSKIFMDTKLAKQVEGSKAYKAGYKAKGKGKNPYKKDTADFHLYILGQQSAQSE